MEPRVIDTESTQAQKIALAQRAYENPIATIRAAGGLTLYEFLQYFWDEVSTDTFCDNWHIRYLCDELERIAYRVSDNTPREYDLIVNIPPGMTKTIICSVMFPVWCWTRWHWMKFITASYSAALSLESAEYSRDIIRSQRFHEMYPELDIKEDKDVKSNYKVIKKSWIRPNKVPRLLQGGNRFSTSVGGTLTGFHGHILIVDDPLNPEEAASEKELQNCNRWLTQTLSTRKTDKAVTPTIMIMQRLHQNDPTGHILAKQKKNIRHISLPGTLRMGDQDYTSKVKPPELQARYIDGLLDVNRMGDDVLKDLLADLGQYGFAGQIGQDPTPPGGGMFRVDHFQVLDTLPSRVNFMHCVRYWDKAATAAGGAYSVGVKMSRLTNERWIIHDVRRGQWSTEDREQMIRETAEADGTDVHVIIEQEPGSGGKDSARATILMLAGYHCTADRPTGDKIHRADTYSVQVNEGNIHLLRGEWNGKFIDEHRYFPYGTYKDQVDAAGGAFRHLTVRRQVRILGKHR